MVVPVKRKFLLFQVRPSRRLRRQHQIIHKYWKGKVSNVFGKLIKRKRLFLLTFICISIFTCGMAAQAAVSPLAIELGEAQESGMTTDSIGYWDLQENIALTYVDAYDRLDENGGGEFFTLFAQSARDVRLEYKGGAGGGFMDAGQVSKPAGLGALQITPAFLAYNQTQNITASHLYILKTLTLGYTALYIDDLQYIDDDPYVNFTLYKLNGAPVKVAVTPPAPAYPQTPAAPAAPQQWPGEDDQSGNTEALTEITFTQKPMEVNGRSFVPMRDLFETLGAEINWDGSTQTILATKGQNKVQLQIGNNVAWFNGQARQLEASPFINGDKTFVPLRFAAEALGEQVDYDSATGKVIFGNHYFYLNQGSSSNTTSQGKSPADQSNATSGSDDLMDDVQKYWNERMRYDAINKSLFGY